MWSSSAEGNGAATGQGVVGAAKLGHTHVTLTSPSPNRPNQRALPLNKDWARAGSGGSVYGRDGVIFTKCSIAGSSEKEENERRRGKEPQKGRRRPRKKKGRTGKKEDLYKRVNR